MTDQPARVQFARRFTVRTPGQPDLHGVQFPSGHVIADVPYEGLIGATTVDHLIENMPGAVVHWAAEASEEQQ